MGYGETNLKSQNISFNKMGGVVFVLEQFKNDRVKVLIIKRRKRDRQGLATRQEARNPEQESTSVRVLVMRTTTGLKI